MASFAMVLGDKPRVYQVEAGSGSGGRDEPFALTEPYHWVPCPNNTTEFHTFNGAGFDEPAALPRRARGYSLLRALTDDQVEKLKAKDAGRLAARSDDFIPETSDFVVRLAKVVGLKPSAWFDAASDAAG